MSFYFHMAALLGGSYLIGCFCSAYYLVRWKTGEDLRQLHSGTLGARNCGRVLGPWAFVLSLVIDVLKGALVVFSAQRVLPGLPAAEMAALAAVLLGHVYPVQLGFKGGKGVSVLLGGLLAVNPLVLLAIAAVAGLTVPIFRRTNQAMIIAIAALPITAIFLFDDLVYAYGFSAIAVLILFFHKKNIRDILRAYKVGDTE